MATSPQDIADFYQQLALLVKADLPLPDSLRQLAAGFRQREFRQVLDQLGSDSAKGVALADLMRRHPQYFSPLHVRLVEVGEQSGTLGETLFAVGRLAREQHVLLSRLRETLAYPLFAIWFAAVIAAALLNFVIPVFHDFHTDMLGDIPPPLLTQGVFALSALVVTMWWQVVVMLLALALVALWLATGSLGADQMLYRVLAVTPGIRRVVRCLDFARLCALLGLLLDRHVPLPDALGQCAAAMEGTRLVTRLRAWADAVQRGGRFAAVIAADGAADRLFVLTVEHAPEAGLAQELTDLSRLYEQRADSIRSTVIATWTIVGFILMVLTTSAVLMSVFLPLIRTIDALGGG